MKYVLLLAAILTVGSAFAAKKPTLVPCDKEDLASLMESIQDEQREQNATAYLMVNAKKQVVGMYSWDNNGIGVHAETCDFPTMDDVTSANTMYYWNDDDRSSDPTTWKKGDSFGLTQDEGSASISFVKKEKGVITVKFEMEGFPSEEGPMETVTLTSDVVTLELVK